MKKAAWIILAILVAGGAFVFAAGSGWLGQDEKAGEVLAEPYRAAAWTAALTRSQR